MKETQEQVQYRLDQEQKMLIARLDFEDAKRKYASGYLDWLIEREHTLIGYQRFAADAVNVKDTIGD